MTGYRDLKPGVPLLSGFPGLTNKELEAVNDLYPHYLFYQKDGRGRRVWTSCCHRENVYIGPDRELVRPEERAALWAKHGDSVTCPFCGRRVEVTCIGTARRCTKLSRYIPVVFLKASRDGNTVYAQAYWTCKGYNGNYAARPAYMPTRAYRLRRGEVSTWERSDYPEYGKMLPKQARFTPQPFSLNTDNPGYRVIGLPCLKKSFLRYTQYEHWDVHSRSDGGLHTSLIRFLALGALYPESVEMLMKAGMQEPIEDYIYRHRKNHGVLRWGEKDPRQAFGLTKEALRTFLGGRRTMETLYVYHAYRRAGVKLGMGDAEWAADGLSCYRHPPRETAKVCAAAGVKPEKLVRYLERYTGGCHAGGYRRMRDILYHWWDYIDAAKRLGYDMTAPGVLMPRDLQEAHDNATALVRRQEEERRARERAERDAAEREKLRRAKQKFEKRLDKLRHKYEFSAAGYCIRVAESADEIIAEGKALGHCVAGYAERHLAGKLTILFLRRASEPDKPLVTIEMDGDRLVQVHGYRNEMEPCPENPGMIPAREKYRRVLDPWLAWVAAGSKRDKRGLPKLPHPKKKENAA